MYFQLHGTKWNSDVPRFAANLGFSPLQPMRPASNGGVLKPTPATSTVVTTAGGEVPVAQFDWDGSGLVNPLHGKWWRMRESFRVGKK